MRSGDEASKRSGRRGDAGAARRGVREPRNATISVASLAVAVFALVPLAVAAPAAAAPSHPTGSRPHLPAPAWELRPTGTEAQFRGLAAVNRSTAWLAGSGGTVLRTRDGGVTWQDVSPSTAGDLEFRDVEAFGPRSAAVLAIGPGEASRIYLTRDGGRSWRETFGNDDPAAFYNCMDFFDRRHGLAVSDPVDGKFRILATSDGGRTWRVRPSGGMPAALGGEYNFAASGTCLVTGPGGRAWFATGGAAARVFRTSDTGHTWQVTTTPVAAGPTAGIYSLAFRDRRHGIAVGGDYTRPGSAEAAAAVTSDGGRTWRPVPADRSPAGYRSGAEWLSPGLPVALTVGPTGSEFSLDGGRTWRAIGTGMFDSVDCAALACWASGADGRAARLTLRSR